MLELCASLHVYTGFLIEGFVEHAAKLLKFNMVEHLGETLEDTWREELAESALHELFPKDEGIARQREALDGLHAHAAGLQGVRTSKACKWDASCDQIVSRTPLYRRELEQCAGRTSGQSAGDLLQICEHEPPPLSASETSRYLGVRFPTAC